MKITRDSFIGEVLMEHPQAQEIMLKHLGEEVACIFCPGQSFDTFGMIAELHGIPDEAVNEMLVELNQLVQKETAPLDK